MTTKDEMKQAIKEANQEIRAERLKNELAKDMAGMTASICAGFGFVLGFVPTLLTGTLGLILIGSGVISAILTFFLFTRTGRSPLISGLITGVMIVVPFLMTYGVMWYFMVYLLHNGQPLFTFPAPK